MSRFEYLSVLVSIVIGLGLTELTISWGRSIQNRERVRFDWLHGFWSAFTLFMMVQLWWGFWNYRTVTSWSMFALVCIVAQTIVLVLCAIVLAPRLTVSGDTVNLRLLFVQNRRPFFLLGATYVALLALVDWLILGSPVVHPENAFRAGGLLLALTAAVSASERAQPAIAAIAIVLMTGFVLTAITL